MMLYVAKLSLPYYAVLHGHSLPIVTLLCAGPGDSVEQWLALSPLSNRNASWGQGKHVSWVFSRNVHRT